MTNEGSASLHEKLLAHQLDFILLMIDDCELQRKYDYLFFSLEQKQILLGIPSFHPLYDKGGTATAPAPFQSFLPWKMLRLFSQISEP